MKITFQKGVMPWTSRFTNVLSSQIEDSKTIISHKCEVFITFIVRTYTYSTLYNFYKVENITDFSNTYFTLGKYIPLSV